MNDWLVQLGVAGWKPLLGVLAMPPVPLLVIALVGLGLMRHQRQERPQHLRRRIGLALLLAALLGCWAMCTTVVGHTLVQVLTRPPEPLNGLQVAALRGAKDTAIVVLGAGRRLQAPEYGTPDLTPLTLERLRYGLWLGRETGLPVAYSGGVGHGSPAGATEAEIAQLVATRDFQQPLRWLEQRSRDTRENGQYSVALLRAQGLRRVVLVTHGFHQQRAVSAFAAAARTQGVDMALLPASMGLPVVRGWRLGDWLPTAEGFAMTRVALHEWLGWLAGA